MRVSMDLSVDWSKKVRRVATRFYSWLETILFHLALTILAWSMAWNPKHDSNMELCSVRAIP